MKKFLVIALSLSLLCMLLTACGKPANMDDTTYNLGKEAVEVGNNYLNGKTSSSDASKKLHDIFEKLDSYTPTNSANHNYVTSTVLNMSLYTGIIGSKENFEEQHNMLKKHLNMS